MRTTPSTFNAISSRDHDAQAERCPPFRVCFALTFSDAFAAADLLTTWPEQAREIVLDGEIAVSDDAVATHRQPAGRHLRHRPG